MFSNNKKNSFVSFLDNLAEEIEKENEIKKSTKASIELNPIRTKKTKKKSTSIIGYLNDLVENMDRNFGEIDFEESEKRDLEAQRKLKAELRNKHAEKFKKASEKKPEGDTKARKRLEEAQVKKKTDKIREELAKEKNRQRLKDAIIMAEILGPPVSKRR